MVTSCVVVITYVLFSAAIIKPFRGGIANIHTKKLLDDLQLESKELKNHFLEIDIKKKQEIPWLVNLVYAIQDGSTIPAVPRIKSDFIAFQTINYVVSNSTYMENLKLFERLGYYTNITVTNFANDNDYLAFLLSFYYKSDVSVVVKVNSTADSISMADEIGHWIDQAVSFDGIFGKNSLVTGKLQCMTLANNQSSFVLIANPALRHLLMYTDITYSYESLFSLLPKVGASSPQWLYYQLPSRSRVPFQPEREKEIISLLNEQKCKPLNATPDSSISVFLRTYQRDYIHRQVSLLLSQTKPPDVIVILQNRNLVDLHLDDLVQTFAANGTKILYLWNINWNSFFHLSYLVSSLMPTDLSFTYDDDQLLSNETTHELVVRELVKQPITYSLRSWCWCKQFYSHAKSMLCLRMCEQIETDLVVNPFFTFSHVAKYTWRYDIPTYYCCEEMSLLFAAKIECGIGWKHLPLEYESYQMDQQDRSKDEYTIKLRQQSRWDFIEHDAMTYYTKAGYKPSAFYDSRYRTMEKTVNPI